MKYKILTHILASCL